MTIGAGSQGVVAAGTSPTPAAGGATSFKGHSPRFSNASAGAVVQALDTNRAAEAAGGGPGGGIGHFNPNPGTFYGAGGGAYYSSGNPRAGAGLQGAVRLRWHDPATAAGAAPALFSLAAEGMAAGMRTAAPRAAAEPVTLNLYDPATGQGSVWREEDALAKLAEGMLSEETWLEICAAKAAEEHAAWLADPATEAERFEMLRQARDARLAATDYLTAADYPLPDEQRTAVTAYRQGLRDLPAQPGAPWDGGGELTPWPELPSMLQPAVQPEEPVQSENTEV